MVMASRGVRIADLLVEAFGRSAENWNWALFTVWQPFWRRAIIGC